MHNAQGMGCGDNAIEEDLDGGEVCCFGADIAGVVNAVATHGPIHVVGHVLLGVECADHMEVCGLGAGW